MPNRWIAALCAAATALPIAAARAEQTPRRYSLEVETGLAWQARNDVQIPNTAAGTRFSIADAVGSGPVPTVRFEFALALTDRQDLRFLVAPLGFDESGQLPGPVNFNGASFNAASPTDISYRFNSYRATWRYRVVEGDAWTVKLGVTGKIRDAEITLTQGGVTSTDSNVGFVPLLHAWAERRLGERLRLILDFDGLAAPQGRAIDFAAKVGYDITPALMVTAGWRVLDGGVDNDTVYNFARFNSGVVSLVYRF